MGAWRPFFMMGALVTQVYDREKELQREISRQVEDALPGVEVLAVELSGPERFTVFVDHPQGVDHALCARVTALLRSYLDRYSVDVSSPGATRPLRKPGHFASAVGRRVAVRTSHDIAGRKRFRGEVLAADAQAVSLGAEGGEAVLIPYEEIVRGNVIDEPVIDEGGKR
jgi:ribosome maturation factor RimP